MTDEPVTEQEMVAHVFALREGPDADASTAAVQAVWERCRDLLGTTEPVAGLATVLDAAGAVPQRGRPAAVAGMRRPDGLAEAVVRCEDETLVLSLLLAAGLDPVWPELDDRLARVLGDDAGGLLGLCVLRLGKYPEAGGAPSAERGRAVAALLPDLRYPDGWWHEGVRTGGGLGLWELTREDGADREFVVLADPAPAADEALTRWTWRLPGTTDLPPFARYLLHAAKIRYQLGVLSAYPAADELRRIRAAGPGAAEAIAETAARLRTMRLAVHTSWANAMRALEPAGDAPPLDGTDLFGRDAALVGWLTDQLRADIAFWEEQSPPRFAGPRPPGAAPTVRGRPLRLLAIADEWFPATGGISQLNLALCTALAEAGAEVTCVVPRADRREQADAAGRLVRLEVSDALYARLNGAGPAREPLLPALDPPDAVLGHSRFTGPIAREAVERQWPGAVRVHVVHMVADHIEGAKGGDPSRTAEVRGDQEIDLGSGAQVVVSVGPVLHGWTSREMPAGPVLHLLRPGFDLPPGGDREVPGGDPKIMLMGRTRDDRNKGLDLACRAIGRAAWLTSYRTRWDLLVRGVPEGAAPDFTRQLHAWTAGAPSVRVIPPRYYSTDPHVVQRDLRTSALLPMASRAEGYGLVGHEALVAGTPLLASARSGLGTFLGEQLPPDLARLIVIPVHDDAADVDRWGHYIAAVLDNLPAAFQVANEARHAMARKFTWEMAAVELLEVLRPLVPG